ncbi:MAG TPA: cupin-like domain-containing protein, partial [Noviherbaspirillum sp.]
MEQAAAARSIPVNDDWRRWIAENLMLDNDPNGMFQVMVKNGVSPDDAGRELQAAMSSPYMNGARQASQRLKNRLKKHDWILEIHRKLARQSPNCMEIERRERLTRAEFYVRYYLNNKPVIITGMLEDWPARKKWNFQ